MSAENARAEPVDDSDTDNEDEEEEEASFLEWLSEKLDNSKQIAIVKSAAGKLVSGSKTVASWGGSLAWVVGSTAVIVGFPLLLGINNERQLIELQKQMTAQQGAAAGPGGLPAQ